MAKKKYTLVPADAFKQIQTNAGVLLKNFDVSTATVAASDIVCATTGGIQFADTVTYVDFGEDIDNCPANMKEFKRANGHEVKLSGTAVSLSSKFVKDMVGSAEVSQPSANVTKVTPLNELKDSDFQTLWWVGDYGEDGFAAIELLNALSTGGFQLQSTDEGKGQSSFEFTGHYELAEQDKVPYNLYLCEGGEE